MRLDASCHMSTATWHPPEVVHILSLSFFKASGKISDAFSPEPRESLSSFKGLL